MEHVGDTELLMRDWMMQQICTPSCTVMPTSHALQGVTVKNHVRFNLSIDMAWHSVTLTLGAVMLDITHKLDTLDCCLVLMVIRTGRVFVCNP